MKGYEKPTNVLGGYAHGLGVHHGSDLRRTKPRNY